MSKYAIHITHNDADAIGCALIASLCFENLDIHNHTYFCGANDASAKLNEILDEIDENNSHSENEKMDYPSLILISDISIDEDTCSRIEKLKSEHAVENLMGFDHHKTNQVGLDPNHDWFIVNCSEPLYDDKLMTRELPSACKIMLEYFGNGCTSEFIARCKNCTNINSVNKFSSHIIEPFINSISRYDTWEWKKVPENRKLVAKYNNKIVDDDYCAILQKFFGCEELYNRLYYKLTNELMYSYFKNEMSDECPDAEMGLYDSNDLLIYWQLKEKEKDSLSHFMNKVRYISYTAYGKDYSVLAFISNDDYSNFKADYLYNQYPSIDIVVMLFPASNTVSFRTNKPDIDVSTVAKRLGGGGHKSAAGAKMADEDYIEILEEFYLNAKPFNEEMIK